MAEESTSFWARLKQHHIYRVAAWYGATIAVLIQVVARAFPYFGWSAAVPAVIIILIAGFPVAIVLAWILVKPTNPASQTRWQKRHWKLGAVVVPIVIAAVVVSGYFAWGFSERHAQSLAEASAAASAIPAKSIAVLPFENLSGDKDNAYFADGMQDLILTKLADIGDLKVISRTSTEKYASRPGDLKTVGQQLGVATILEGSVQKAGNQVLINVQLIDARTDNHIWAQSYQRTLDNIFGVEGEVAQKVADALKAKLTSTEQQNVTAIPTTNPEAYDAFLRAESLAYKAQDSEQEQDYLVADAAYKKAIALDPGFALAYARLAYNQMNRDWFGKHLSTEELISVKKTVDRALILAPDLPEAHLALGYYDYWGFRHYDAAVQQFQRTLQLAPNNLLALAGLAYIDRRTGRFEQALRTFAKVISLAPRDRLFMTEYGITYQILRRYPEATQQMLRALAIDPEYADARDFLVRVRLFGFGDAQGARAALNPPPAWRISHSNNLAGGLVNLVNPRVYPDLFARHFDAALHDWDSAPTDTEEERLTQRVARVAIQIVAGRQSAIQRECNKLNSLLAVELAKQPDSLYVLQQTSWVDVCLGHDAEAIIAARRATEVLPLSADAYFGAIQLEGLAEIDAHAGAPGAAVELIGKLMAIPAGECMSILRLQLDPVWDPLRGDPRFQALLKQYVQYKSAITYDTLPAAASSP